VGTKSIMDIKNLSVIYHTPHGELTALHNLSFNVLDGEFISIVGPSGCGKSTLLNVLAGLIKPSSGEVLIDKKAVRAPSNVVGYMPQRDQLFEWRNIWKNVVLGLEVQHQLNVKTAEYARHLLNDYGLLEFQYCYPSQLSGGMRQRVALIRTLAINPSILLLDEAFSALDYQTRLIVNDEVKQIIKREKKTAILVTHDISEAISMSDRVIVLSNRPASVKKIYKIQLNQGFDTPLKSRDAPEFGHYFNEIWRELDIHV